MNKKLLYIDHSFHYKTQSARFLEESLACVYDIEACSLDPCDTCLEKVLDSFKDIEFDVLVLFQVMPNIEQLKKNISAKHFVFFPMFDGSGGEEECFWRSYKEFNIINFSLALHKRLLSLGLSSYYIQYFPKPLEGFNYGDPTKVFFWQRVTELNINMVGRLLQRIVVSKIHLHKVLDPLQEFVEPSKSMQAKIEYSDWYETREEMLKDVEACAVYIAPRPYEGIGMSFLEAMAMGRCVIAPDCPTMNEYITHGQNGLLYDFHLLKAVKIENIVRIQRNAFEYIKKGYIQWEKDKYKIIDWLEAPLQKKTDALNDDYHQYFNVKSYQLFKLIPLLTIKEKLYKRYYYLFNCWYILKSRCRRNRTIFYLFGVIPIWRIYRF